MKVKSVVSTTAPFRRIVRCSGGRYSLYDVKSPACACRYSNCRRYIKWHQANASDRTRVLPTFFYPVATSKNSDFASLKRGEWLLPLKCPKCGSRNTVTETAGNIAKVTRDDRFLTLASGYISQTVPELLKEIIRGAIQRLFRFLEQRRRNNA